MLTSRDEVGADPPVGVHGNAVPLAHGLAHLYTGGIGGSDHANKGGDDVSDLHFCREDVIGESGNCFWGWCLNWFDRSMLWIMS